MASFDLSKVGSEAEILSEEEVQVVRRRILDIEESMQDLVQELERCKAVIAPRKHLPEDVLRCIFTLCAYDHGKVSIPPRPDMFPPQVALPQVCSKWRRIVLTMPEIWTNLNITWKNDINSSLIRTWLSRADMLSIDIDLHLEEIDAEQTASIFQQQVFMPFPVDRLHLFLKDDHLMSLAELDTDELPYLRELHMTMALTGDEESGFPSHLPSFFKLIQSVRIYDPDPDSHLPFYISPLIYPLLWSQLRHLELRTALVLIPDGLRLLRQTPLLEKCSLSLMPLINLLFTYDDSVTSVSMSDIGEIYLPYLRIFELTIEGNEVVDWISHSLKVPNLINVTFVAHCDLTLENYLCIQELFHFQQLEELRIVAPEIPLSVKRVLTDAPQLHCLELDEGFTIDDDTIIKLSSGHLGRSLYHLALDFDCNLEKILEMTETRQKLANCDAESQGSHEGITPFKYLRLFCPLWQIQEHRKRIDAISEQGVRFQVGYFE
ncbi:hypothetical protein AX17_002561 [Amanita inopinata Kibby_2008]|nr:hypothetical protein AX17_002561 [Amanita inopinata Kibby_2008]